MLEVERLKIEIDGTNPLRDNYNDYDFGDGNTEPSTSAAGAGQASLAPVPTASVPTENFSNNDTPNIIPPNAYAEVTTRPPQAPNNGAAAPPNGGFSYTSQQLNNSWLSNFTSALFSPSSFGSARGRSISVYTNKRPLVDK
jgi:hypothetical protein